MKVRDAHILDDELVAIAEADLDVVADLPGGVDQRLKRRDMEVADIDAVAEIEMLDGVDAHALAEQELVVALIAAEFVFAGAAEQEIPSGAAEQVVVAFAADQSIVALSTEQRVVAFTS